MPMTDDEVEYMADMWDEGLKVKEIAERIGYSFATVYGKIVSDRDKFPLRNKRVPLEDRRTWAMLISSGAATVDEAARSTGVSRSAVRYWVEKLGDSGIRDPDFRRPTCHGCFIECEAVMNIVDDVWEFPCSASMIEWASRNRYHRPGETVYEGSGSI